MCIRDRVDSVLETFNARSLLDGISVETVFSIDVYSSFSKGSSCNNESIKKRYPFGVGILPEDVCGEAIKPRSSRSDMTFRIVAELKLKPSLDASFFDPIGVPSSM